METSACTSSSDFSSVTAASTEGKNINYTIKSEYVESMETMPEIDESFWSDAAMDDKSSTIPSNSWTTSNELTPQYPIDSAKTFQQSYGYSSNFDDGMDFWYDLFIRSGNSIELPEFWIFQELIDGIINFGRYQTLFLNILVNWTWPYKIEGVHNFWSGNYAVTSSKSQSHSLTKEI